MSDIAFRPASERELTQWDDFVESAFNGTLFHLRAFLGYHGERFAGAERWLVAAIDNQIIAQLVYALSEDARGRRLASSPYGASYGGLVLRRQPSYSAARDLVIALVAHLRAEEVDILRLTPPIACYAPTSQDTLAFALLEQGFCSVNRDITSVVPLGGGKPVAEIISSRARRNARRAANNGVSVTLGAGAEDFWMPMDATFARHGAQPTHDRAQLADLMRRVPDRIRLDVGYLDGEPAAGVGLFVVNRRAACSFYLCQSEASMEVQGLTLTLQASMERCQRDGFAFYDMGTSSVGMQARENIFRFKEGFSAEGFFRESFEWRADR